MWSIYRDGVRILSVFQFEKFDIIESMKKGIKENPTTKKYLDKMVSDDIDEDTALNIMIYAWLNHNRWNDE